MAEPPPPPLPRRMPLLPLPLHQSMPLLPESLPTPKVPVAVARTPRPMAAPLHQAQPPVAALPQPRPPPPPVAALPQPQPPPPPIATPSSPRDHVAQNPRIGDSGDVESGPVMSTVELHEEDGVADELDSTSLSDICARMIESCTYTVEVKVCGSGTENYEDSTFSWDIVDGSSSSLKDLLASIAGTFPLFSGESIMIEYVDSISGKNICVSNDEECLKISKAILVAPDSPAMGTRSKKSVSPDSPAMSTRSKKRVVPNSQVMATGSKKKLKL